MRDSLPRVVIRSGSQPSLIHSDVTVGMVSEANDGPFSLEGLCLNDLEEDIGLRFMIPCASMRPQCAQLVPSRGHGRRSLVLRIVNKYIVMLRYEKDAAYKKES
jgi:hypothetical protein